MKSLLASLANAGIKVAVSGDQLRLTGRVELLTDGIKETLRQRKAELLALLSGPSYPAYWLSLAESGKTDMEVDGLDDALFLFAIRKVHKTPITELEPMWQRFEPYWKERLSKVAYQVLVAEYGTCANGASSIS